MSFVQLADYLAHEARAADLLIINPGHGLSALDAPLRLNVGDLVMRIGRPVLLVPPSIHALDLDMAIVAWKDTREARRAVADALPLLRRCGHVVLVGIAPKTDLLVADQHLKDVSRWLGQYGITADLQVVVTHGEDAITLKAIANEHGAGLMIAGAYGHGRLNEWAFGGVTSDPLLNPARCTLVSH